MIESVTHFEVINASLIQLHIQGCEKTASINTST